MRGSQLPGVQYSRFSGQLVDECEYPESSASALERKVILMVGESLVPAAQKEESAVFLSPSLK